MFFANFAGSAFAAFVAYFTNSVLKILKHFLLPDKNFCVALASSTLLNWYVLTTASFK